MQKSEGKEISYFDPEIDDALITFLLVLLAESRYSHLPELLNLLGGKKTLEFLSVFGGSIIRVPTPEELNNAAKEVDIYICIERCEGKSNAILGSELRRLSEQYNVTRDQLKRIHARLDESFGPIYQAWKGKHGEQDTSGEG